MTRRTALALLLLLDLAALLALATPPAATAQDGTVPPTIGQPWAETPTPTPDGPVLVCGGGHCWVSPAALYLPLVSH